MKLFKWLLALSLLVFSGCALSEYRKVSAARIYMDTLFEIIVYSKFPDVETKKHIDAAYTLISNLEAKYSATLTNSELYRANFTGRWAADGETLALIDRANQAYAFSGGMFDITVRPLMTAWGFTTDRKAIPTPETLKAALLKVGNSNVVVESGMITLKNGAQIDLGGLMKGYAVDKAVEYLEQQGFRAGLVNAGGNLRTFGSKPDGTKWTVGIRHPRKSDGIYTSFERSGDFAIATSGDYERYFETDGVRYHHIMNPKTGFPIQNGVAGVTVATKTAMEADIYSTTFFIFGVSDGIRFADRENIAVFYIYLKNGELFSAQSAAWTRMIETNTNTRSSQ